MSLFIIDLLQKTAWYADAPKPYSGFHIIFSVTGIIAAAGAAYGLSRLSARKSSGNFHLRILFLCGLILALGEAYKQLFLYYIVDGGRYDWWYFPFQLCSMPMYLCLLLPLFSGQTVFRRIVCTFLQDFGLLGGIMALAEPSGLLHPYWLLTVHGLLWHVILIFISLFISFSGLSGRTGKDFAQTLPLLALFCGIATVINIATRGAADMFYISPYYPITQVVFHSIALRFGNAAGIGAYLACLCAGGWLCHRLAGILNTGQYK